MKTRRQMFDHAVSLQRQSTIAFDDMDATERKLREAVLDAQRKKKEAYDKCSMLNTTKPWHHPDIEGALKELRRAKKNLADFMNE